jgi:hypothetical protein
MEKEKEWVNVYCKEHYTKAEIGDRTFWEEKVENRKCNVEFCEEPVVK